LGLIYLVAEDAFNIQGRMPIRLAGMQEVGQRREQLPRRSAKSEDILSLKSGGTRDRFRLTELSLAIRTEEISSVKILTMCMECQKELGNPSFEPIIADYYEEALAYIECSKGHKSAILLQSQKFEVLLESAANALIEGYTLEAASSLSSAYERFFEFAINVYCKKSNISKESLGETFKQVSKQSERQIGGFLFLHLLTFKSHYALNKKIPELRNQVIHQGYIPTPDEVLKLGDLIYKEILSITKLIKSSLANEMQQVVMDTLQRRDEKIPSEIPRATTTGAMFFSLAATEQKDSFQEALSSYKEAREKINGSVPFLRAFSKAVALFSKPRSSV
jgi:hypothetical protein